ncbi:MAG: lipoyl(octanoyl) transferase LipB [Bacteroidetes bacterium]|nr:lipoyl(octanoyl) transferase LipB [Bacteroidota bacterium]
MPRQVQFIDFGRKGYKETWDLQEELFQQNVSKKLANRSVGLPDGTGTVDRLIFVEHPHVYTLGKSGDALKEIDATYFPINRGGDITYHGPGQIVGYPLLDLEHYFKDIHKYMRYLEEAIIRTLAHYGLKGTRIEGLTGVWLKNADGIGDRKIAALGVKCSRWLTMHGFAFNVNTDLTYFNHIVPCGITDKKVTSLQTEIGHTCELNEVKRILLQELCEVFQFEIAPWSVD